jgi:DNA-binding NarL/FixJ family response regulator
MNDLSVFLVDDHQLFREGMKLVLSKIPYIREVREASSGTEFLGLWEAEPADVVFMDIEMPGMNGIETTRLALEKFPDMRIIALSMYEDEAYCTRMIDAGAKGFILKNSNIQEVEDAILNVAAGKNYFSQEIITRMIRGLSEKKREEKHGDLSERETEVLRYICKGYSNKEIADTLFLSKRTVDKHRENILTKTGARNTAGLVMYAVQCGIIEL